MNRPISKLRTPVAALLVALVAAVSGCAKREALPGDSVSDDGSVTLEVQGDPDKFPELFTMIQRSDYVRITDIRQKDLPPDPWERGFSVRGY